MNKLPKENFLLVTEYLDFDTRFQLSLVCKSWHSVISSHNLYETVYIEKEHEEIINFFNNKKLYGKTVKSLQVDGIGINFSILKDWPNYFPNIQNLSLSISEIDMFASDFEDEEEEEEVEEEEEDDCFYKSHTSFKQWNRLSSISEFTKYMYTSSILISGYYPNLTTIDLNFNIIPFHASNTVMDNLIKSIKNAPNLKYLKLIVAQLTLKKLNLLHQNSPNIEGLVLEDIALGQDGDDNTEELVTTTTKLKRLEMQGSRHSFYENEQLSIHDWLDYISKSYQEIEVIKMNQFTPANIEYQDAIINVVNHCKHLKTFNVDFCHFSSSVLQAFDNNTSIKLEKYSSQSQDLTELRNLSCSNQRHSIYRLDLVVPINNTDLIEILNQFTGLTTINTYPSSDVDYALGRQLQVPINTFLKHHKLLEFLSLSSCHIYMDKKDGDSKVKSVLDTLEMEKVTIIDKDIFKFISTSCLQLKVMIMTAKFHQKQELDTPTILSFPNHIIVYLKIYIEGQAFIELQEYLKSTTRYFKVENEGRKIMYTNQQKETNEEKGLLVIQAKKVERFVVNLPRDPFQIV